MAKKNLKEIVKWCIYHRDHRVHKKKKTPTTFQREGSPTTEINRNVTDSFRPQKSLEDLSQSYS